MDPERPSPPQAEVDEPAVPPVIGDAAIASAEEAESAPAAEPAAPAEVEIAEEIAAAETTGETAEAGAVPSEAPAAPADGYQVKLQIFEGPLDLLLFLIRKKKIEIHDIPIAQITRDYLDYLDRKDSINLDREAEFLFVAALLIYIKSQMLLPRETDLAEGEDPRRVLVDRLVEYQKVKVASSLLRRREEDRILQWTRTRRPPLPEPEGPELLDVSLFGLAECFFRMMKRHEADARRVVRGRDVSLEDTIRALLDVLEKETAIDFLEYMDRLESLQEALISFFGLLELVKNRRVAAVQDELFQTIRVWIRKEAARTPHP